MTLTPEQKEARRKGIGKVYCSANKKGVVSVRTFWEGA